MDEERRARFKAWFGAVYGEKDDARAKFMKDSAKLGGEAMTKGRVAQLFDPGQPFGERAARSLAERFGLASDFFLRDAPGTAPPVERAAANLTALRRINPETFDSLIAEIERITEGAKASDRVIRTNTKSAYVTPARAQEKLGKATPEDGKQSTKGRTSRGGMSGLGGLDELPSTNKQSKPKK